MIPFIRQRRVDGDLYAFTISTRLDMVRWRVVRCARIDAPSRVMGQGYHTPYGGLVQVRGAHATRRVFGGRLLELRRCLRDIIREYRGCEGARGDGRMTSPAARARGP